VKEKFP